MRPSAKLPMAATQSTATITAPETRRLLASHRQKYFYERALLEEHELEVVEGRVLHEVDGPEEVAPRRDGQGDHVIDGEERPARHDGQ